MRQIKRFFLATALVCVLLMPETGYALSATPDQIARESAAVEALALDAIAANRVFGQMASLGAASSMTIQNLALLSPEPVEKYARFEASFDVVGGVATNPYFPYDPATPAGVEAGTGISVEMLLLEPGQVAWESARTQPCFYYQPVEEVGEGSKADLVPIGQPEWRCRFTPDKPGAWTFKIRATDASGMTEGSVERFQCVDSGRKGFVRVSRTDPRFYEFSDGAPFVTPLINQEAGNPFNGLERLRTNIQKLGENGARFIRWFPTGEGANYYIIPYGDDIRSSWTFGPAGVTTDRVDVAGGNQFSYQPYFYTVSEPVPVLPEARYRLTVRAEVTGDKIFRPEVVLDSRARVEMSICAREGLCETPSTGWNTHTIEFANSSGAASLQVWLRDGFADHEDTPGTIRVSSVSLQRDETGSGGWGPNLLTRPDPDTYRYVDQKGAARLDEVFRLSEQYGVYHKLTLFHKNDPMLGRIWPDGSVGSEPDVNRFYSGDGQAARWYEMAYARYFIARWSYSPSLHSLELSNENMLSQASYEAGFAMARYIQEISPRPVLMSNSFWGWFVEPFWADPSHGHLMDYADKHWYANETGAGDGEMISTITDDSAANVRQCWSRFQEYAATFDMHKPLVRGETGVAVAGTSPQHPGIAGDLEGIYYHKKLWAHVGAVGYLCDGEWYTQALDANGLWGMYAAYERFMAGEPLANGRYAALGTDLSGADGIGLAAGSGSLRAWGARDRQTGNTLLWIDNANHTWRAVVAGADITPSSGTLILQGMPPGNYAGEWWDTYQGGIAATSLHTVGQNGELSLSIDSLDKDIALKLQPLLSPAFPPEHGVYLPLIQR